MTVFINLDSSLVSQVSVNGEIQHVEYEALPTICFSCGKYRKVKYICPSLAMDPVSESRKKAAFEVPREAMIGTGVMAETTYGLSMMVEQKSWHGKSDFRGPKDKVTEKETLGSRFMALPVHKTVIGRGLNADFEAQVEFVNLAGVRVDGGASFDHGNVGLLTKKLGKRTLHIFGLNQVLFFYFGDF
ncbi:hypothetical protein GOBAR_AA07206 [Gossypium barbadense]|uniref:Zinc knuckle CX2CX4HX4C domain-containing protein n=1 Tax=Gossypium barbadense TaxID=3634 RepID=A0A2P5YCW0_GOSBA|nr:hypothetical protein GOBAR_AA07206 [Gossypium barbadense]